MMKHKTSELTGVLLDAAVAMAEGMERHACNGLDYWWASGLDEGWRSNPSCAHERVEWFTPSTDWTTGGPLIERERVHVAPLFDEPGWRASMAFSLPGRDGSNTEVGDTPLIAAMRAYVFSRFGEEVELP